MRKTERVLEWILKGGLLLSPFLVFVVTRSLYFPFITGKNFAFRILVEVLAVIWVYAALRFPRFRPRSSLLSWAAVSFIAALGIATVLALSPYRSFWSNFERMEGYIGLLHLFLYFLLLGSVFIRERDWTIFFHTSLAASVIVSFYSLLQLAGTLEIHQGRNRVDATFGNATYLAAYLLFHLFFLAWFFLRTQNRFLRIGYALTAVLEAVILYHTATRGAILGMLGGLVVLAIIFAATARGPIRRWAVVSLGVIVAVPIIFFLVKDSSFVKRSPVLDRFASISLVEQTTKSRFTIWKMAIAGWQERPIFGWGQDSFLYVFSKYYEPSLWSQEPWFDRAHNVFLDWLIAGGLLGLLSYLSMFATAIWVLLRAVKAKIIGVASLGVLVALLSAHFFENLFVFDNLTSYLLFFAVLAYIHTLGVQLGEAKRTDAAKRPARGSATGEAFGMKWLPPLGGALAVVAFLPIFYFGSVKPILTAKAILDALVIGQQAQAAGKVDAEIESLKRGIALHSFGTMEVREQISQIAPQLGRDQSIAAQDKAKFLEFAVAELEAQYAAFPTDVRAQAFLSTLYSLAGRPADALRIIDESLKLSSRRQQFYFVAAEAYLNLNESAKSVNVLKKAYDLSPDYPEAIANLATVYILSGKDDEARALLQKHYGVPMVADERYAQTYIQINRFDKAAEVWELLVQKAPENFQYHAALGVSYARSSRGPAGIGEIQKAIEIEPRFKAQGDSIIEQIKSGKLK